jgi:hypothetical protein
MTGRTASVVVCDNILSDITAKIYLYGLYPVDISIPGNELLVNQLAFYFSIFTPNERPFKHVILRVTPPESATTEMNYPLAGVHDAVKNPNRPKMIFRAPLLLQQILLKVGKIETKVILDNDEELDAGGIWVSSVGTQA